MKTVVITGSTSGIGKLLVQKFADLGYRVFAGFRNGDLKNGLVQISENVVPFFIDMADKDTIADAAKFINANTEKIDTLINAAGFVVAGPMECLNVDKIREQFEVNTFSHLDLTQKLFEKLSKGGAGKIINISSESSFGFFPFIAPYCASKRALDILFNTLQLECWKDVKVISVKPGVIQTPLWEKSIELNKDVLHGNEKYKKEFAYMVKNAKENETSGLTMEQVVSLILKINDMKNPKPSYTIGFDAKAAEIVSHLPQGIINFIVRKSLERKMNT